MIAVNAFFYHVTPGWISTNNDKPRTYRPLWMRVRLSIPPPRTGVNSGTRTHDSRDHNPMFYQLNYIHHINLGWQGGLLNRLRLLLRHMTSFSV